MMLRPATPIDEDPTVATPADDRADDELCDVVAWVDGVPSCEGLSLGVEDRGDDDYLGELEIRLEHLPCDGQLKLHVIDRLNEIIEALE